MNQDQNKAESLEDVALRVAETTIAGTGVTHEYAALREENASAQQRAFDWSQKYGDALVRIDELTSQLSALQAGGEAVYCVPVEHEGRIVYDHSDKPIPMADNFKLYTAPVINQQVAELPEPELYSGETGQGEPVNFTTKKATNQMWQRGWYSEATVRKLLAAIPTHPVSANQPAIVGKVPDAMTFLRDNDLAASDDWMQGWNDCRAMLASAPAIQPQAAVPIDENGQLLGTEHKGMRVDYTGMLGQAIKGLRANPGLGFMLSELERNITEVGDRYYSGDIKAVDEFLQLYCVARDKRAMLATPADSSEGK